MSERAGQELSAETRQLIANARGADDPTAEDESRVKARWLAGIAAGAGVSSLSEAVRAAASTGWSWGLKSAVLAGAAAVAAVGVYLGWPETEPFPVEATSVSRGNSPPVHEAGGEEAVAQHAQAEKATSAPLLAPATPEAAEPPSDESSVAPSPAAMPLPDQPAPEPPPEVAAVGAAGEGASPGGASVATPEPPVARAAGPRQARSTAARPKPTSRSSTRKPALEVTASEPAVAPASPAATGQLGEEIARLSEIRGQLQSGSAARALELLGEYRSRFAEPNLAMEADALQVDALCKAGKHEGAREAATAFTSRWPGSPLAQRVSSACK